MNFGSFRNNKNSAWNYADRVTVEAMLQLRTHRSPKIESLDMYT